MAILLAAGGRLETGHLLQDAAAIAVCVTHILGNDNLGGDPAVFAVEVGAEVTLGGLAGSAQSAVLLINPEVAKGSEVGRSGTGVAVNDKEGLRVGRLGADELGQVLHEGSKAGAVAKRLSVAHGLVVQVVAVQTVLLNLVQDGLGGIDDPLGVVAVLVHGLVGGGIGGTGSRAGVTGGRFQLLLGHLAGDDAAHVVVLVLFVGLHEGRNLGLHHPGVVLQKTGDAAAHEFHALHLLAGLHFLVVQGAELGNAAPEVDHIHGVGDIGKTEGHGAVVGEEDIGDAASGDAVLVEGSLLPLAQVLVVGLVTNGIHGTGTLDIGSPGFHRMNAGGALYGDGLHVLVTGRENQRGAHHQYIDCLFHCCKGYFLSHQSWVPPLSPAPLLASLSRRVMASVTAALLAWNSEAG